MLPRVKWIKEDLVEAMYKDGVWGAAEVVGRHGKRTVVCFQNPEVPELGRLYLARKDETLANIAEKLSHQHDLRHALVSANASRPWARGLDGDKLAKAKLEALTAVVVPELVLTEENDTPSRLADHYGRDVDALLRANPVLFGAGLKHVKTKKGTLVVLPLARLSACVPHPPQPLEHIYVAADGTASGALCRELVIETLLGPDSFSCASLDATPAAVDGEFRHADEGKVWRRVDQPPARGLPEVGDRLFVKVGDRLFVKVNKPGDDSNEPEEVWRPAIVVVGGDRESFECDVGGDRESFECVVGGDREWVVGCNLVDEGDGPDGWLRAVAASPPAIGTASPPWAEVRKFDTVLPAKQVRPRPPPPPAGWLESLQDGAAVEVQQDGLWWGAALDGAPPPLGLLRFDANFNVAVFAWDNFVAAVDADQLRPAQSWCTADRTWVASVEVEAEAQALAARKAAAEAEPKAAAQGKAAAVTAVEAEGDDATTESEPEAELEPEAEPEAEPEPEPPEAEPEAEPEPEPEPGPEPERQQEVQLLVRGQPVKRLPPHPEYDFPVVIDPRATAYLEVVIDPAKCAKRRLGPVAAPRCKRAAGKTASGQTPKPQAVAGAGLTAHFPTAKPTKAAGVARRRAVERKRPPPPPEPIGVDGAADPGLEEGMDNSMENSMEFEAAEVGGDELGEPDLD